MKPTHRESLQVALAAQKPILTEVELLVSESARRVSVNEHAAFQKSLSAHTADEDFDDLTVVDPYEVHAPGRRSDREVSKLLTLLDNLESGKAITQ